jgi:hypothetical protein
MEDIQMTKERTPTWSGGYDPTKRSGNGPTPTPVTADAIRNDGLSVAENIRTLAKQAKDEGESVAAYAEEVAGLITQAASEVADRITDYMAKCQAARASMGEHQQALMGSDPRQPAPKAETPSPAEADALTAVHDALLPSDSGRRFGPDAPLPRNKGPQ